MCQNHTSSPTCSEGSISLDPTFLALLFEPNWRRTSGIEGAAAADRGTTALSYPCSHCRLQCLANEAETVSRISSTFENPEIADSQFVYDMPRTFPVPPTYLQYVR